MTSPQDNPKRKGRLPKWLKTRLPASGEMRRVDDLLSDLKLATVCCGAHCPNQFECFGRGTATFLILGETCTRDCRFCAIRHQPPGPPRADEPQAVAEACDRLGLKYVVITSVTRDDLSDGGAGHFAKTIQAVRQRLPQARIEVLTPDFQGNDAAVDTVLAARPDVFNHNVETVPRLYPAIRPEADYARSLHVLSRVSGSGESPLSSGGLAPSTPCLRMGLHGSLSKSGLMLGLGETAEEIEQVLRDLRGVGCDIVTIGQYLAPSPGHAPVARFVEPAEFEAWKRKAEDMGFLAVASGPFVRSSYRAEALFPEQ